MLIVTEHARQRLKGMLVANADDPQVCLRLVLRSPTRLGLVLDEAMEGDQVVEHEGLRVMLVDHEISVSLDGGILDVESTADSERLSLSI